MANPVIVDLYKNQIKKIATDTPALTVNRLSKTPSNYFWSYRATGEDAPTSTSEFVPMFKDSKDFQYLKSEDGNIDVYAYCKRNSGRIRVDNKNGGSADIQAVYSTSGNGVISTSFADDYAAQGKAFQIQRRITLTNEQTLYLVLDTTALVAAGKRLIVLPLLLQTNGGSVFVDTYPITSYTGGNEIKFARINSTIENYAESVFYSGVTPSGTPSPNEKREYIVGSLSTNQTAGGGAIQADIPKRFSAGSIITAKLVNQETSNVSLDFGIIVYEI